MEKILLRIKALEEELAIYDEVLKVRLDRKIRERYRAASQALEVNVALYSQLTKATYRPQIPSFSSVKKEWSVKVGPCFSNGNKSRELYVNGILYRNLLTLTEARQIMEQLT